jgi:hypothetical protein
MSKKWVVRLEITDLKSKYTRAQIRQIFKEDLEYRYMEDDLTVSHVGVFDPDKRGEAV